MIEIDKGKSNQSKIVKTVCNMCLIRCGLNVHVENGRIIRVEGMPEHPYSKLCVKAHAIPELVHSPDRLQNPMIKANGRWNEVSWDEAFAFIVEKLDRIKREYGSKAIIVHTGNPFIATQTEKVIRRFADLCGTPNYTTGSSFCFYARVIGHSLTCGTYILADYAQKTKCAVVWGFNPTESYPLQSDSIYADIGRGAKLIVIDPRRTGMAKRADIHAQLRPGTDCALALGLLHVIIKENLYDKSFTRDWTIGFDQLAEYVQAFTPEKVEEITWIKADTIREMAVIYATNKPAAINLGISLDHNTNGIQAIRAITALVAITGNLDIPGGNIYADAFRQTNLRLEDKITEDIPVGAEYPCFTQFAREQSMAPAIDGILNEKPYPIKSLLIAAANAGINWPNTGKVRKAFEKLDLVVLTETFMTETAKMADVVLPGTTFLEREDLRDYRLRGLNLLIRANKVVEPVGNSMEDWKIWAELGKRMGYSEYFPWQTTDELCEFLLETTNVSLDQLKQIPGGVYHTEKRYRKYLEDGFNTPSKKVELYSEHMRELGYDPIPTFREPAGSPVSRPDLADTYPLLLITGARTVVYLHSEYRNLPSLRKLEPEPRVQIHPRTAGDLHIADGDFVKVQSLRGSIILKARLTEDIHPKVLSVQHGWNGANPNWLVDDEARDPVSGYPGFRQVMCRVEKAEKPRE